MQGFVWAGDLNGQKNPLVGKFYVPDATAVKKGQVLRFVAGTGLAALNNPAAFDEAIFGVSQQEKAASDGTTEIEVSYSPTAIYKYSARRAISLDNGSTSTAVVTDMNTNDVTDIFKGGAIRIVSCAADSTLNGKVVGITAFNAGNGTMTLGETLPNTLAAADVINVVPGNLAAGYTKWDLDSTSVHPHFGTISGKCLKFLWSNLDTLESYYMFQQHQLANVISIA